LRTVDAAEGVERGGGAKKSLNGTRVKFDHKAAGRSRKKKGEDF